MISFEVIHYEIDFEWKIKVYRIEVNCVFFTVYRVFIYALKYEKKKNKTSTTKETWEMAYAAHKSSQVEN